MSIRSKISSGLAVVALAFVAVLGAGAGVASAVDASAFNILVVNDTATTATVSFDAPYQCTAGQITINYTVNGDARTAVVNNGLGHATPGVGTNDGLPAGCSYIAGTGVDPSGVAPLRLSFQITGLTPSTIYVLDVTSVKSENIGQDNQVDSTSANTITIDANTGTKQFVTQPDPNAAVDYPSYTPPASYAPSAGGSNGEDGAKALSVTEAQVNAARYTSYTVTSAGVTFHGVQTGRQVWIQVASTPTVVASTNPTSSELFVDAATIASSGKIGAHTLFVTNNDGTILAKAPIEIGANGSLSAGNGQGGVENTASAQINPAIPVGIVLIVMIGVASVVIARRKSTNI